MSQITQNLELVELILDLFEFPMSRGWMSSIFPGSFGTDYSFPDYPFDYFLVFESAIMVILSFIHSHKYHKNWEAEVRALETQLVEQYIDNAFISWFMSMICGVEALNKGVYTSMFEFRHSKFCVVWCLNYEPKMSTNVLLSIFIDSNHCMLSLTYVWYTMTTL